MPSLSLDIILILGIAGTGVFALAVWRPVLCLSLTLAAYLFVGQLKAFIPISVTAAAAALPVFALLGSLLRGNKPRLGPAEAIMIATGAILALSVRYSLSPGYGTAKALVFCGMVVPLVVALPSVLRSPAALRKMMRVLTVTLVVYVGTSLVLAGSAQEVGGRISALMDVTAAGQFLGLALLVLVVRAMDASLGSGVRIVLGGLAVVAFVLMIRTGTRAPFVAVVGSLGFLLWYGRDWMRRHLRIDALRGARYLLVFTLSLVVGYAVVSTVVSSDILSRYSSYGALFSNFTGSGTGVSDGRAFNYALAIKGFAANPWLGVGAGGYRALLLPFLPVYSFGVAEGAPLYPHNLILEFAVELGSIGLALVFGLLYLVFRGLFRLRAKMNARNGFDIIVYAAFFIYGLGVSMTALDISRMVILWWGCGLVLASEAVFVGRRKKVPARPRVPIGAVS